MRISVEEKKAEAIERMKALGIFPQTIKQFKDEGYISISEPPLGAFYWAEGEDLARIRQFEAEHDALVPFSAFAQMTGGNTDCIYGLAIRALYPGTSEDDGGMVEQCFYFKLNSDAKSAIDKNAEKDTAITTDKFTDVKSGDYFADAGTC